MQKAKDILRVLSKEYTKPIKEKYIDAALKIASMEERMQMLKSFGLFDKAKVCNDSLIEMMEALKEEFDGE
jgi:hypothetical protein